MSKRIGILGGISPESTLEYYKTIVRKYHEQKKDFEYPEIIIYSVSLYRMMRFKGVEPKEEYVKELMNGITALSNAGADFAIVAANTPHVVFHELEELSPIPLISIVKATLEEARRRHLSKLLLLGTKITMQSDFYSDEAAKLGIEIVKPSETEQEIIERIIFKELVKGILRKESKDQLAKIIENHKDRVTGAILGCTELPLIIEQGDTDLALLNTTEIHALAALKHSLAE